MYAGFIRSQMTDMEFVPAKHEGLISLETFQRNQALISGRKPATSTPRMNIEYPLKHTLLCTNCHKSLTGSAPTTGSGKRSPRYHCTRCTGMGSVSVRDMDAIFNELLMDIMPKDGTMYYTPL